MYDFDILQQVVPMEFFMELLRKQKQDIGMVELGFLIEAQVQ